MIPTMPIKPPPGWDLRGYPPPPQEIKDALDKVSEWALRNRQEPGRGRLLVVASHQPRLAGMALDDAILLGLSLIDAAVITDPSLAADLDSEYQKNYVHVLDDLAENPTEALAFIVALARRLYDTHKTDEGCLPASDPMAAFEKKG